MRNSCLLARTSVVAGVIALLVGCGGNRSESGATKPGVPNDRPLVQASAAEALPDGRALHTLRFFDELESRNLVAHDDAIEGVLLLATGRGGENFRHRVNLAKQLGLLDSAFARPAREASTIGEVSSMVVRVLGRTGPGQGDDPQQAVAELVSLSILPPPARTQQGLTGAQLVSILGGADDVMRREGIPRTPQPRAGKLPHAEHQTDGTYTHPEPLPELLPELGAASKPLGPTKLGPTKPGPTQEATSARQAAERQQVSERLKASMDRLGGGKIRGKAPASPTQTTTPSAPENADETVDDSEQKPKKVE